MKEMNTRVRGLTVMNVSALRTIGCGETLGATYAEFVGGPAEALAALNRLMPPPSHSDSLYRSLIAVRRKLQDALAHMGTPDVTGPWAPTPYVTVTPVEPPKGC